MSLSLTLLGGFELESNGTPLPLSARKARALLAALALARHRRLSRARLARLLWGVSDPEQARGSLRQTLTRLRRAGVTITTPELDSVALPDAVDIDVDAFRAALARGDAAEAIRRYRGDLMEGQTFRDPFIEDWLEAERTRLRGLASEAFAAELDRLGDRPEGAELAHRLLALEPLRERAHRTLMRLDAARGDTAAALARFAALRDLLRHELDAPPEPETMALAEAIRGGRLPRSRLGEVGEAPSSHAPAPTDVHLRQVVVLAALEADQASGGDWTAILAEAVLAAGGTVPLSDEGHLVAVWGLERTREDDAMAAAGVANAVLDEIGARASLGLAESTLLLGDAAVPATRMGSRALRLAASTEPGTLATEPRLAARLARPPRPAPTLVGREAELGQMLGAVRVALSGERGVVIHLGGEAGIGKTRLTRQIADELAASGVVTVQIGFDSFGSAAHLGQRIAAALPDTPRPAVDDPFDAAVLAMLERRELAVGDRLRLDALAPEERLRRELAMTEALLAAAAGPSGLLLVVEDCHWARHVASAYLLHLSDAAARHPLVMLLSERPYEESLGPRLAARGQAPLIRLSLGPLSPAAAERLARSVGAGERRTARALALAGGHPLFLLRLLETELADERLPPTISALVQEQIERLPDAERTALRQASILGRRFVSAEFRDIFDTLPPTPTGDLLVADGESSLFGHDLIHRAVYESVPEDLRRRLHARVASYYRDRDAIRWVDHARLSDDDADATRATAAAANAMIAARRFPLALPYIEDGLSRAGDPEAIAELHSCRAAVHRIHGDLHAALEDYRAAHAQAIRHPTRASMLTRTALVLHRLDRLSEADRALDDAEEIADRAGIGGGVRAEIHHQRGVLAFSSGDHGACAQHHAAALALAESTQDRRAVARAHGGLGDAARAAGRMRTACSHYERAIAIAREDGYGMVIEEFGYVHAYARHLSDPGPHAAALADLAVEEARDCGAFHTEMIARLVRSDIRLSGLDLAGTEEDLCRVAELLPGSREQRFADDLVEMRALLAYRRGDPSEANAVLGPIVEADASLGRTAARRLGILALVGDGAERRRAIEIGSELARRPQRAQGVLWFHWLVLESALRHEEPALARVEIDALRACTATEPLGWVELVIENAELHLAPDAKRARALGERAEAAGIRDLPPLRTR